MITDILIWMAISYALIVVCFVPLIPKRTRYSEQAKRQHEPPERLTNRKPL